MHGSIQHWGFDSLSVCKYPKQMKVIKQHNYYPEDMVPLSAVRAHLRYGFGDEEELIKLYMESACDYMETLTNRVFSSSVPAEKHEDVSGILNNTPTPIDATVTVYLDREDKDCIHTLAGVTGTWALATADYLNDTGQWSPLQNEYLPRVRVTGYPVEIDLSEIDEPADAAVHGTDLYRITLTGGDNVIDLPRQYRQAMLLLVGHYDAHRETEVMGAVTNELKEGVRRLLSTVKQF